MINASIKPLAGINRVGARRGQGLNKLRTYRGFKQDFVTEKYVKMAMPRCHRSAFAKFRCGVAPIRVETGRYERLPFEERLCPVCEGGEVETEKHVLMQCPAYRDIREELFTCASDVIPSWAQETTDFCFNALMCNNLLVRPVARACHMILNFRRQTLFS